MIIGIDGGALAVNDVRLKVGVYKVSLRLLENISRIGYSNNYRIYTFRKIGDSGCIFQASNVEERLLTPSIGWQKIRLPLELAMHPVNVFLGLSQMLPYSKSHNIGFIYDLGFIHSPDDYPGSYIKLRNNTEYLVRHSDSVITISHTIKNEIVRRYQIPSRRIYVSYPGVDGIFSRNGPKKNFSKPYFLYVGALKPGKNIPVLIRAFGLFLKSVKKPYDLVLVGGDFWPDPEIGHTIRALKLDQSVIRPGYIPDSDLAAYYRSATGFVTLSLHEGFSIPVAEAMASGLPLVVADSGALPEISGDAAVKVKADDVGRVAAAMAEILKPEIRSKLAANGLRISSKYTWRDFTEGVVSVIDQYAGNKK